MKTLYIMGYGRSGSTILDVVLGNHPAIFGAGELAELPRWVEEQQRCACGDHVAQCRVWSRVLHELKARLGPNALGRLARLQARYEPRNRLPFLLAEVLRGSGEGSRGYGEYLEKLYAGIVEATRRSVIVDSSKSAGLTYGRSLALAKLTDLDVRFIFLVRDGRGVMWSALKGPGSPERSTGSIESIRVLKALISWALTNMACLFTLRVLPSEAVVRVRYEDLVTEPVRELRRIGKVMDVSVEPLIEMLTEDMPFRTGHRIAGNRIRFAESIRLEPDFQWKAALPPFYQLAYQVFGKPVGSRLNYHD